MSNPKDIIVPLSIFSAFNDALVYPLTSLKNIAQTSQQGPLACYRAIMQNKLASGQRFPLFKGVGFSMASQAAYSFSAVLLSDAFADEDLKPWQKHLASGAVMGAAKALSHPLEVLSITKQRLAENFNHPTISQRFKVEGAGFLLKGIGASTLHAFLGRSATFALYDLFRQKSLRDQDCPALLPDADGDFPKYLAAEVIVAAITQPLSFAKTRLSQNMSPFVGPNLLAYYRGFSLVLARMSLSFVIVGSVVQLARSSQGDI